MGWNLDSWRIFYFKYQYYFFSWSFMSVSGCQAVACSYWFILLPCILDRLRTLPSNKCALWTSLNSHQRCDGLYIILLCWEAGPCVTLLVSKLFEELLSGLIPLVFAPIIVLQSHLGIVKGSSTQDTILIRVLQINLCAGGSCGNCWVQKLHITLLGWFLNSTIRIPTQTW